MSKLALVTGGSGGLGAAICHKLANFGYKVILTYNSNPQSAQKVLSELSGEGHQAFQLNVSDSVAIDALAKNRLLYSSEAADE